MAIVKKEETKVVEVKTVAEKAPVAKKAAAPKKAAVKEAAPKAAEPAAPKAAEPKKEAAPKNAAVKKTEAKATVVIEFGGKQISTKTILDQATKAFTKANKGTEIKTIEVYVKPEEAAAYYVVNGLGSDEYKVTL